MATQNGRSNSPLAKKLFEQPYAFDFFQAVRLLERIHPEREPVGRDGGPSREVARFNARVSLAFPPSQIYGLTNGATGDDGPQPARMTVSFMGLTGPSGALPHPYTELLIERNRYKDATLREFLDIFNHRLVSFFYRAWEKYRFPVAFERGEEDQFTESLFDLIGLGTPGLRGRHNMRDQGLLYYSGLVAQRPHSAESIQALLSDYFGLPIEIEQFSGQWLNLDEESLSKFGTANNQLGVNTIAGARVWDTQSKFRLKIGPMTLKDLVAFLPSGSAFRATVELTRLLVGLEFDFDLQLVVKAEEVPGLILTTRAKRRPTLGWTTWLKTMPFAEDDSQVVLAAGGATQSV